MKNLLLFILLSCTTLLFAQNDETDLLSSLTEEPRVEYTTASFKTNRIINGHSIENTARGVMDVKISHRFSPVRRGLYDLFGLDGATIRIGVDYGITDRLMVGIGRNSREKIYDGFAKYKILRQSTGKRVMPVSLSYLIDAQIRTQRQPERENGENYFSSNVFYTHQVLIARKFSEGLSLQLMPTLVHRNIVATPRDKNDVFALGAGGRIKLTRRVSVTAEYYYVLPDQLVTTPYKNSLSIGFDIETGGHVFQFHFTNSQDMTYKGFITESQEAWFFKDGNDKLRSGIRFGFNISRVFTIVKPKDF